MSTPGRLIVYHDLQVHLLAQVHLAAWKPAELPAARLSQAAMISVRKLKIRDTKVFAQGHTAPKCESLSWGSPSGCLTLRRSSLCLCPHSLQRGTAWPAGEGKVLEPGAEDLLCAHTGSSPQAPPVVVGAPDIGVRAPQAALEPRAGAAPRSRQIGTVCSQHTRQSLRGVCG